MPTPEFLISAALPVGEYCLRNIDFAELAEYLDYLNIMGYDLAGNWSPVCGHHAQLHSVAPANSVSNGIRYVLDRNFPSQRVLLGIPVYARYFTGATSPGSVFSEGGGMDYCDVPPHWLSGANVDQGTATASIVDVSDDGSGKGFVSMDIPQTVASKAAYATANGLGGLFYWTGSGGKKGEDSLVLSGYLGLCRSYN